MWILLLLSCGRTADTLDEACEKRICPDVQTVDCMPMVRPENQKACRARCTNFLREECGVQFTY